MLDPCPSCPTRCPIAPIGQLRREKTSPRFSSCERCRERDSNPHDRSHPILSRARLTSSAIPAKSGYRPSPRPTCAGAARDRPTERARRRRTPERKAQRRARAPKLVAGRRRLSRCRCQRSARLHERSGRGNNTVQFRHPGGVRVQPAAATDLRGRGSRPPDRTRAPKAHTRAESTARGTRARGTRAQRPCPSEAGEGKTQSRSAISAGDTVRADVA